MKSKDILNFKQYAKSKIGNTVYCYDKTSGLTLKFDKEWNLSSKYFDVLEYDQEIDTITEEEAFKITGSNAEKLEETIEKLNKILSINV